MIDLAKLEVYVIEPEPGTHTKTIGWRSGDKGDVFSYDIIRKGDETRALLQLAQSLLMAGYPSDASLADTMAETIGKVHGSEWYARQHDMLDAASKGPITVQGPFDCTTSPRVTDPDNEGHDFVQAGGDHTFYIFCTRCAAVRNLSDTRDGHAQ